MPGFKPIIRSNVLSQNFFQSIYLEESESSPFTYLVIRLIELFFRFFRLFISSDSLSLRYRFWISTGFEGLGFIKLRF